MEMSARCGNDLTILGYLHKLPSLLGSLNRKVGNKIYIGGDPSCSYLILFINLFLFIF